MKKKILLVYTGGTIGMTYTERGLMPEKEAFHELLNKMPELRADSMPDWDIVDMDPLLDSTNIAVNEWNNIGGVIADNYEAYDGFVILHGTDTMAYTASALSFMLENNKKPVVLTGSQIPLCEVRNDARDNLITSMLVAAEGVVSEVCLCFGGKIIRGNRSMKQSADGLLAFDSPNYPLLAEARINISYNYPAIYEPFITGPFYLRKLETIPIGVIKVFPGIHFELFSHIMTEDLKGIVVETFGSGNIPGNGLLPIIKKAAINGTVMIVCSQCPQGTVSLGAYETSDSLMKAGAVSGVDITTEAAVAKLYYLFSCGYDVRTIEAMMGEDLRGEISSAE